ncbi:198_t:CDS:2 [Ambispora gerdemannii]|uniref:198_t:CDS:1 n=1 Tax=Ambispora gerdemannii TaxID=144530 RepID=A0A9N8W7V4_9GLOM|nr:198_t:CDS:2 [Ambispora gerdemannii]
MEFEPDFAASYYLTITLLCIIIALATQHQLLQILRYTRRLRSPRLIDLPTEPREKMAAVVSYDYSRPIRDAGIAPEAKKIHSQLLVIAHKIWNYAIFVFGFGDQSVGEIVIFQAYIALNLIFLYMSLQPGESVNADFTDRTAYLALANAAFIFPLATRNSAFLILLGVPFERVIKYHRWVGRMIFFMIAFHGAYHIQTKYQSTSIYDTLFGDKKYYTGFWASMSLVVIMITSHSVVRRHAFELFYWSHFIFIFFVAFGILHTEWFLPFVGFGTALYIVDRLVRCFLSYRTVKVESIEAIQMGVTRVVFEQKSYYEAGQYVFVNFPNLKSPLSFLKWHPVSLSSAPSILDDGLNYATIHLKCAGGFTKSLYESAYQEMKSSLKLKVDGPYGRTRIDFTEYRSVLLVGGGIGITPMISLLRDLVDRQVAGFSLVTQSIYFVWVIPDHDSYAWFSSEFTEIRNHASALINTKYLLDIKIFLTKAETTPSSIFFKGRPKFNLLLNQIKGCNGSGDIAVGACGPAPMIREIRRAAVSESDAVGLIKVHTETFEL